LKILHLITGLNAGGAEGVLYRLILSDKKNLHQVVSLTNNGYYEKELITKKIKVKSLNLKRGTFSLLALIRLIKIFRKNKPDIIQTWMYHADLIGGIAGKISGNKNIIWSIRNSNLGRNTSWKTKLILKLCILFSRVLPKLIISCSKNSAAIHENLGYPKKKITIIPNGFDLEKIKPSETEREKIRKSFDIKDEEILIGVIARWDPQKDFENLFLAIKELKNKNFSKWKLILVGSNLTPENKELMSLVKKNDISNKIVLAGFQKNIVSFQNAIDLLVLSSAYGEAFPNVIAESMACEVPCVATDVGDSKEIISNTGWIVPPNNPQQLCEVISKAFDEIKNKNHWLERKKNCRNEILKKYSLLDMTNNYQKIWNDHQ
tara:strand:+ start:1024 stop:2151 length:1128 start_codon:yes stop_codon:yes gene_type:complete